MGQQGRVLLWKHSAQLAPRRVRGSDLSTFGTFLTAVRSCVCSNGLSVTRMHLPFQNGRGRGGGFPYPYPPARGSDAGPEGVSSREWTLRSSPPVQHAAAVREGAGPSSAACVAFALSVFLLLFLFNLDTIIDILTPPPSSSPNRGSGGELGPGGLASSSESAGTLPLYYQTNKQREHALAQVGMDRLKRYSLQFKSEFFFFVFDPDAPGAAVIKTASLKNGISAGHRGLMPPFPYSTVPLSLLASGPATVQLYTTRTIFQSLRMALLRIHFDVSSVLASLCSVRFPYNVFDFLSRPFRDRDLYLTGVDLRDLRKADFQGFSPLLDLPVVRGLHVSRGSPDTAWCSYSASLHLNFEPGLGKSARETDEAAMAVLSQKAVQGSDIAAPPMEPFLFGRTRRLHSTGASAARDLTSARAHSLFSYSAPEGDFHQGTSPHTGLLGTTPTESPGGTSAIDKELLSLEEEQDEDTTHADVVGEILSSDCGFYVFFRGWEVDYIALASHITSLTLIFNVKTLLEMRLFWKQMQHTEGAGGLGSATSQALLQRVSVVGLAWHVALDVFEAIAILRVAMHLQLMMAYFAILIMFKSILFGAMEVRYLMSVWNARQERDSPDMDIMRRALGLLYKNFFGLLVVLVLFVYYVFPAFPPLCVPLYFVWLPQIAWDVWKAQRNSMDGQFVIGISLCRLVFPTYLFGCPVSLFQSSFHGVKLPNYPVLVVVIIIMIVQVALMQAQRRFGSRFFVPLDLLPHVYNYHRPLPSSLADDPEAGLPECAICMNPVDTKSKHRSVTPCDHLFHDKCLQQWMEIKMECPNCRGKSACPCPLGGTVLVACQL
ncbi:zinc c3hc4 type (ring finger) domain-containing protein [Cystoisospora suis]|uniref:RING-type E3 ubiquitin transferase n=1 Tax=Cystoisospora suis TaxID=483139 RepID=A0A2C6L0P2_9APIC|nr:zinc c3hc4 type (ring finger) domain-containing protein [Cystoisospora suis]